MTFLALKTWLLSIVLLGCAGGPDEFELGYGHLFQGDSSLEGWQMNNEDSDIVTVGLVWKLKPTEVEVVNPVYQPGWRTLKTEVDHATEAVNPVYRQDAEEAEEHLVQDLTEAVDAFDAFGTVTKIGFFLLAGLVLWTYRERIGRLIPGGGNGGKSKG